MAELVVVLVMAIFWLVPMAAGVWAIITLQQLRTGQHAVQTKLEAIEHLLQRS